MGDLGEGGIPFEESAGCLCTTAVSVPPPRDDPKQTKRVASFPCTQRMSGKAVPSIIIPGAMFCYIAIRVLL